MLLCSHLSFSHWDPRGSWVVASKCLLNLTSLTKVPPLACVNSTSLVWLILWRVAFDCLFSGPFKKCLAPFEAEVAVLRSALTQFKKCLAPFETEVAALRSALTQLLLFSAPPLIRNSTERCSCFQSRRRDNGQIGCDVSTIGCTVSPPAFLLVPK